MDTVKKYVTDLGESIKAMPPYEREKLALSLSSLLGLIVRIRMGKKFERGEIKNPHRYYFIQYASPILMALNRINLELQYKNDNLK